jgi:hypothetical protein
VIRLFLVWLMAIALAALPVAAWAAPCSMAASGQMAASDEAGAKSMPAACDQKPAKCCTKLCMATTAVALDLPGTVSVAGSVRTKILAFARTAAVLTASPPAGLDRPPRTIA